MPPTVRELVTDGRAPGTAPSVSTGVGTAVGDLLVAFYADDYGTLAQAASTPGGTSGTWTTVTRQEVNPGSSTRGHGCLWTRSVTTAGAQTVSAGSANAEAGCALYVYVVTGADLSSPLDAWQAAWSGASTFTAHTIPSLTSERPNGLLLAFSLADCNASGANINYTVPSGMTADVELEPTLYMTTRAARLALGAPGTTGDKTFTSSAARQYLSIGAIVQSPQQGPLMFFGES
jgi:hypothetical protein